MIRALTLAAFLLASTSAWPCAPQLEVPALLRLSPWVTEPLAQGGTLAEPFDITVSGTAGCGALALGVEIDPDTAGSLLLTSGPNGAPIGREPGAGLALLPLAGDRNGRAHAQATLLWSAHGDALPAGTVTRRLRLRVFPADALLPEPLHQAEISVIADIPAVLDVSVLGPGGRSALAGTRTLLDLGEITAGARHGLDIEIRGNTAAQVTVTPEHGELRLVGRPGHRIPYALQLDGRPVDKSGLTEILQLGSGLMRARLDLQVGDVERRAAGEYVDVLVISVAPE
jgi:hypothetical protein